MVTDTDSLRTWAGALRALATDIGQATAADVAAEMTAHLDASLAAHRSPEGETWLLREADGQPALQNAAKAVRVAAVKNAAVAFVSGPTALHHLDANGAASRRGVIPVRVPPDVVSAVQARVAARLAEGLTRG